MSDDPLEEWIRLSNKVDNRSASIVQIESNKLLPFMMLACLLSGGAAVGSIATLFYVNTKVSDMRSDNDMQKRRVEELRIRVEDNDVLLQVAGVKKPGDAITGPAANPKRLKP